jgi:hypothetical protein
MKTDTTRVKQTLDDRRPDMLKRYEAAIASLCEMETKARQTLNAAGVHTIFYVAYLNYARQLYKLSRQQGVSGESFAGTATAFVRRKRWLYPIRPLQVRLDKWANRGPDPSVLARIRTEVFDTSAPTP